MNTTCGYLAAYTFGEVVRALLVLVLVACAGPSSLDCPGGGVCPPGLRCVIDGAQQFCVPPACGNGVLDPGEQCDDGNNVSGDTCSANCQSDRSCGNGILDSGEQCDDGNVRDHDGCSSTCLPETSSWVSIEATPPARSGAAFAYDSIRGRLVMFGGCSSLGGKPEWHSCDGTALDDTWEFDGTLWTQLAITATHPGARYNHAMAFDASRGRVVLFGGGNPNGIGSTLFPTAFDDTWEWDGTTWSKLITPVQPKGRFGHAMAYDSVRHEIVLTGGFCPANGCDPNGNQITTLDTWLWDGTTWTPTAPLVMPPFRYGHAMAFDPHRNVMVLFGGHDLGPTLDGDTWEWDGSTWTEHTTPSTPSGRIHSAMVFDPHLGRVIMFGGCTVRQIAPAGLDWCETAAADLWSWDGTTWISVATQTHPTARFDHALAFDSGRNKLVIFGGNDTYSSRDDLWEWDGVDWRVLGQTAPAARVFVAAAYDSAHGTSVLFGGKDAQAPALYAETWEWDGNVWRNHSNPNGPSARMLHSMAYDTSRDRVVLFGGCNGSMAGTCSASGDTWEWTTMGWTQVAPTTSPTARMGHTLAFDSIRNRVILFGGCTGTTAFGCTPSNETWEFDGATWTLLTPTVSPSARWLHGMTFDPLRGKVVMFGGLEANGQLDNDLWEWDGTTWTPTMGTTSPPAAAGSELAFDGSLVVMFGGCTHVALTSVNLSCVDAPLADTWTWDGSQLGLPVSMPSGRAWFAFTFDSARTEALMFGGNTESETWGWSGAWAVRGDTSEPVNGPSFFGYDARRGKGVLFDGSTWEWDGGWTKQHPSIEPAVAGPLAYDAARGEMVMVPSSQQEVNETWIWDGSTWLQRTPSTVPPSRFEQALVYDAARDRVVMFGGLVADGVTDETWLWDGSDWSLATPSARPPGRFNHQLAYDAKRQRVVMFGGQDRPIAPGLTDTWEWDGNNWLEQSPVISPPPRTGASMVYDFVRQRIVMFGGDGLDDMWQWDGTSWTQLSSIAPDRYQAATIYDAAREQIVMSGLKSQLINGVGIADTELFRYTTARASNACITGFAGCSTDNCDGYCDPLCSALGACDEGRPRCGDGTCSSIESCSLCPADCGECSACGDLNCDSTETCTSCPGDCGVCP